MSFIIIAAILFSHTMAGYPFIVNLQKDRMPNTAHFAVISVILYYDFGLIIETMGLSIGNPYFIPFFDAKPSIVFSAFMLIASAPWLFLAGSKFTNKDNGQNFSHQFSDLKLSTKSLFYAVIVAISVGTSIIGISEIFQSDALWGSREAITAKWGPFILFFYLPLYFLAFYTRQSDSDSQNGLFFSLGLTTATILSTVAIAQRTNMLLPILIIVLFRKKISLQRIGIFVAIAVIVASILLPFFKAQKQESQDVGSNIGILVAETIEVDFYRGGVLVAALERTDPLGTKIMPYPMSGYIYSLLFFFPRELAPFKGWSTSTHFTAIVDKTPVEETKWGFGVGAIEETLLNAGLVLSMPCLFLYGMMMGLLDKASLKVPSLLIPTRLGAIWMCGYESSVMLFAFGSMAGITFLLHLLFVNKRKQNSSEISIIKYRSRD